MGNKITNIELAKSNGVQIFKNLFLGIDVRMILNPDGSISVNAEDAAIGFGWRRTEIKNGKEYHSIMWKRMNGFLKEMGFAHECAKNDYIPESLFYLLAMKANNEKARDFQKWIAIEVIPKIRKTGTYTLSMTTEEKVRAIAQGQTEIRGIVEKQEEEIENLQTKVEDLQEQISVIGAYKNSYKYEELKTAISSHVLTLLPGQLGRVLWAPYFYRAIHAALKNHFKVASSKLIQNNQLDSAKDIVYQWKPTKKYIDEKLKELQSKREAGVLSDKRVAALYYWLSTTDNGKNYTF